MVSLYVLKRCECGLGSPVCFRVPPVFSCVSGAFPSFVAAVCRVWWFVVSSFPVCLSPFSSVSWSSPVRVSSLGWCSSSSSVLVFVSGSPVPLTCRVGSADPAAVSSLVSVLRSARDSGAFVRLATRSGWSSSEWFCGVMESHDALAAEVRRREIASLESALTCLSEPIPAPADERAARVAELKEKLEALAYQRADLEDELELAEADRDLPDWEYYGFSSPEDYVPGRGCGVVGCCVSPDEEE